jgi:N-methylhydantoinase A
VNALLDASATRAREVVRQAVAQGTLAIRRSVDARYIGQGFDLTLALPEGTSKRRTRSACARSSSACTRRSTAWTMPDQDVELVTWSVTASSPTEAPRCINRSRAALRGQRTRAAASMSRRSAAWPNFAVYRRDDLAPGDELSGAGTDRGSADHHRGSGELHRVY